MDHPLRAALHHRTNQVPDLAARLPGTAAAFRDGAITRDKAEIIAAATRLLDPAEARTPRTILPQTARGQRAGPVPAGSGFAGKVTPTIPLATLTGLADRSGEIAGIGPAETTPEARDITRCGA